MNPRSQTQFVQLSPEARAALNSHASTMMPEECCGILAGSMVQNGDTITVTDALPMKNVAQQSHNHNFQLSNDTLLNVARTLRHIGLDIVGFYHSHPHGRPLPSKKDIVASSGWDGYCHIIAAPGNEGEAEIAAYITQKPQWKPVAINEALS